MKVRWVLLAALSAVLAAACQTAPETLFEEVAPADELFVEGKELLKGKTYFGVYTRIDYAKAIETFQSIIDNYPYSEYAVESELEIADAYFADEKYEEALSYYRDFGNLHPQHPKVPYTVFRSALCYESEVEDAQRDQTSTKNALIFLDRLLVKYPRSEFAETAEPMWRELQLRLAEHSEAIGDFYAAREEWEAAAERYRSVLNDNPGLGLDARMLFKLGECYAALNRVDEADRIFRTLVVHYGDSEYAFQAQRLLTANFD